MDVFCQHELDLGEEIFHCEYMGPHEDPHQATLRDFTIRWDDNGRHETFYEFHARRR